LKQWHLTITSDFPDHWVAQAIPYSQLKKCLKKVQRELQDLGLDQETLRALLDAEAAAPVALQYKLRGMDMTRIEGVTPNSHGMFC
jgi:hypothetical protein